LTQEHHTVHYGCAGSEPAVEEIVLAFISSAKAREPTELPIAFAKAAFTYWTAVFPRVRAHVARWERLALRIPDGGLRRPVLAALREKRTNIEGAAAFAAFAPSQLRGRLTHALCAFQAAYNLLDMLGEQPSADPVADGKRLHEALLCALDPHAAPLDWYEHHPHRDDGGYLNSLLAECQRAVASLPSFLVAAPLAREAAARIVAFQSLNLSESQGDHAALEQWAHTATPAGGDLQWWETAAAAGSSLPVYALLAAAAEPRLDAREAQAIERAYFPWIGGLHSLLDNLIDKHEDEAAGHRSLVEYYGPQRAAQRMRWLTDRAIDAARDLPRASGHQVILAGMIGSYLSVPEARTAELEPVASAVLEAAGPLVKPTLLVFKLRELAARGLAARRGSAPASQRASALAAERAAIRLDNFG
jgi:tetraprenyl-beta-curcumene synthase